MNDAQPSLHLFARLWLAWLCFWRVLVSRDFARAVLPASRAYDARALPAGEASPALPEKREAPRPAAPPPKPPPEKEHASALALLAMLQREGRLVDFLQEEVAPFSDAEVGAAARTVHEGCRRVFRQLVTVEPVLKDAEGASVSVPAGFDAQRIRLVGNVTGGGPHTGTLRHPGWVATRVSFPEVSPALDARVVAPAEVELA